jgi:D-alanyl-D-alanine carboxypeptidase
MTTLGRHLLYNYPQYYNLFSRKSTNAGIKTVPNTNRRLLAAYRGADGIKTGYTRAAGFNLVASARRGNERVIATVFGGKSSVSRNARVAELLDLGFRRAPSSAPIRKPAQPTYSGSTPKTIVVASAVTKSLRPKARSLQALVQVAQAAAGDQAKLRVGIAAAMAEAAKPDPATAAASSGVSGQRPNQRPKNLVLASAGQPVNPDPIQEVVTRLSTTGGQFWGINVGRFTTRYKAEKVLLRTALSEMTTLDGTRRKVVRTSRGFDANFMGLTRETADLACRRLEARNVSCSTIGPS